MIQYIFWENCKHNCSFCNLINKEFDNYKLKNLELIYNLLDKEEVREQDKISFMGGEIFDYIDETPQIKELAYKCFKKAFSYIDNSEYKTNHILIMTNLLYDFKHIKELIDFIGSNKDKLIICTSYDVYGRFNKDDKKLFDDNFKKLKDIGIKTHIEIILSVTLLNQIINNEFSIREFMNTYTDNIDFIVPFKREKNLLIKDEMFFPQRNLFLQFLKKEFLELKEYPIERFLLKNNHPDIVYFFHKGKYIVEKERTTSNKLLPADHKNYIDSNITMYQDWERFKKISGVTNG